MHGLINRALQCFLRDMYGPTLWRQVAQDSGVPAEGFEPMLAYPPDLTVRVVAAAAGLLSRDADMLLEDLGTYLVAHPNTRALRRLLRFGGVGFSEFLQSLEELPGRARLALPDIILPGLAVQDLGGHRYRLCCSYPLPGAGHVMTGLLRAMADDYGALALIDHSGGDGSGREVVMIHLLDPGHAEGRRFELVQAVV